MSFDSLLNKLATVMRLVHSTDEIGASEKTRQPQPGTIRGRLQPISGRERAMLGSTGVDASHKWFCRAADIIESDELLIAGNTYRVVWVSGDSSEHHMTVTLQELKHG